MANATARFASISLAAICLLCLLAPWLVGRAGLDINPGDRLLPPGAEHYLGTDHLGRSVTALVLWGGRTSLLVGLLVTLFSVGVACTLGLVSGYFRRVDAVLMRFVDGVMSFPGIVLATTAAGYFGPSVSTVILALSIVLIAPTLRIVRGQVLVVREQPMIEAATSVGVPETRILSHYVLPAILSPLLVQASFIFSAAILGEAALSFIGLGIGAKEFSWGTALSESRNYVDQAWWIVVFPGLALMLVILSLNLLGDALRDALDPRQRGRRT